MLTNTVDPAVIRFEVPCRSQDPDLFFGERTDEIEHAKRLCRPCPIRDACLVEALRRREPWGVWGGEALVDGQVVAHKRGRGRPPRAEMPA